MKTCRTLLGLCVLCIACGSFPLLGAEDGPKGLAALVPVEGELARIDELLQTGKWKEARKRADRVWAAALKGLEPGVENLAVHLALRALAEAGSGRQDEGICHWQAAQHLMPSLYDADLSLYGEPGKLLDKNRWVGVAPVADPAEGASAPIVKKSKGPLPIGFLRAFHGGVPLEVVVTESGGVRQPTVLPMRTAAGQGREVPPPSGLPSPRLLAASALDSVCSWRFQPALLSGTPVAVTQTVTVTFHRPLYGSPRPGSKDSRPSRPELPTAPAIERRDPS
jgi:hypothetical protein